jgi:hypothetical protein
MNDQLKQRAQGDVRKPVVLAVTEIDAVDILELTRL